MLEQNGIKDILLRYVKNGWKADAEYMDMKYVAYIQSPFKKSGPSNEFKTIRFQDLDQKEEIAKITKDILISNYESSVKDKLMKKANLIELLGDDRIEGIRNKLNVSFRFDPVSNWVSSYSDGREDFRQRVKG